MPADCLTMGPPLLLCAWGSQPTSHCLAMGLLLGATAACGQLLQVADAACEDQAQHVEAQDMVLWTIDALEHHQEDTEKQEQLLMWPNYCGVHWPWQQYFLPDLFSHTYQGWVGAMWVSSGVDSVAS